MINSQNKKEIGMCVLLYSVNLVLICYCQCVDTLRLSRERRRCTNLNFKNPTIPPPHMCHKCCDQGPVVFAEVRVSVTSLRRTLGRVTPPPLLSWSLHPHLILKTRRHIKRVDGGSRVLRGQSGLTLDQIHTLTCTCTRGDKMFPKAWGFSDLSLAFVSFRLSMPSHPRIY